MSFFYKSALFAGALFALLAVALGAFGAHALHDRLVAAGSLETWRTAVFYQMSHALALTALGLYARTTKKDSGRLFGAAALFLVVGIVLFSGSLYGLAAGGPRWLGPVTPLGGLSFMAGWACVLVAAWKKPGKDA